MRRREMVSGSAKGLRRVLLAAAVGCVMLTGGCKSWLDQSELARHEGDRLIVPILNNIDPIDEADTAFSTAEDVRPDDLKVVATDYVVGRNDLISVSIWDLTMGGVETVRTNRVSETGLLSLPMLDEPVKAAGLTEQELQRAIARMYREAGLLERAQVSVLVVEARQRTFNIMGAVARPGLYPIVESDFRLLEALVAAGDVMTTQVDHLYVIRQTSSEKPQSQPATGPAPATQEVPTGEDPLAPRSQSGTLVRPVLAMQQEGAAGEVPATRPSGGVPDPEGRIIMVDGKPVVIGATRPVDTVPTETPATQPAGQESTGQQPAYQFGSDLQALPDQRIIRIPVQQLRKGDLRYNIVVRADDLIIVPVPDQAFYYMGGHVAIPGVYNLTGQKITLKQAIISARMLDPLGVPYKTDIIRRVGDREVFVRVNLTKIFDGRQPDIYLKANDVVQVGTDFYPPFLAAIRGAFRVTYGFGFLYDRNFAPAQDQDYN